MSRQTFEAGNHKHNLAGSSHNSNAILNGTGGNQPFDIRQPFTVVQYIIYIQN
jgi:microcystin-dependent protein